MESKEKKMVSQQLVSYFLEHQMIGDVMCTAGLVCFLSVSAVAIRFLIKECKLVNKGE